MFPKCQTRIFSTDSCTAPRPNKNAKCPVRLQREWTHFFAVPKESGANNLPEFFTGGLVGPVVAESATAPHPWPKSALISHELFTVDTRAWYLIPHPRPAVSSSPPPPPLPLPPSRYSHSSPRRSLFRTLQSPDSVTFSCQAYGPFRQPIWS
jgi:hypothetical protein